MFTRSDKQRRFQISLRDLGGLYVLLALAAVLVILACRSGEDVRPAALWTLGTLAFWRYGWWLTHFSRAWIYQHITFPRMRREAQVLWDSGRRPDAVYVMMTTFSERRMVTERVVASLIHESRTTGIPVRLFVGTACQWDENVIAEAIERFGRDVDLTCTFVRQNLPGKRFAMGLVLRAMSRHGVGGDDPVIFMDGDTVLTPGFFERCLPILAADLSLRALTTDEKVVSQAPAWYHNWLRFRFKQRHMYLQSYSLSRKLTVLTGRCSFLRGQDAVSEEMIRTIEADHLDHWLWGRFRFLSGDDKSTWYCLTKKGAEMVYVPDALCYTIDFVDEKPVGRAISNMLRWSGNILRNGQRVINLGPRRTGAFLWWGVVDQRISMWTILVAPTLALVLTLADGIHFLLFYFAWAIISRVTLALLMSVISGRFRASDPIVLYLNSYVSALFKVYLIFRLPTQRWMNRGAQKLVLKRGILLRRFQRAMSSYLTILYVTAFVFIVCTLAQVVVPVDSSGLSWVLASFLPH